MIGMPIPERVDASGCRGHALAAIDRMLRDWEAKAQAHPSLMPQLAKAREARATLDGKGDAYYRLRLGIGPAELLAEVLGAPINKHPLLRDIYWLARRLTWWDALPPERRETETLANTRTQAEQVCLLRRGALTD